MTTTERVPVAPTIVVLDSRRPAHVSMEVFGPLDEGVLEAALDHIAVGYPEHRAGRPSLLRHGPEHHTMHIVPDKDASVPYPAGHLADLLTGLEGGLPVRPRVRSLFAESLPPTPLQRELLAHAVSRPGHHVEQLTWRWHGPLEMARFTAAWQSVFDRESLLRSAVAWNPQPRIVLFARSLPTVVRCAYGSVGDSDDDPEHRYWSELSQLMERERERGFDLRRPGLLRIALLETEPQSDSDHVAPTDVVLTYHKAFLDSWSVHVLLREFHRAYLSGGPLPGGERRPDLRDYTRWLGRQEPSAARDFWTAGASDPVVRLPRAPAGSRTGKSGAGRCRTRLSAEKTQRLTSWAAQWGATESGALHAVWAILLHHSSEAGGRSAPVRFDVAVSGRGVPMEGVERIPGPLAHPLPLTARVDPAGTVAALLQSLRDSLFDMAAYEWVSAGQAREWLGESHDAAPSDSALFFEHRLRPAEETGPALAALGVHVELPDLAAAMASSPLALVAQYERDGSLVLSTVHDRSRLEDDRVEALLERAVGLLQELPSSADASTTVAEVLEALTDAARPRVYDGGDAVAQRPSLVPLREADELGTGAVCLIDPPGVSGSCRERLAKVYRGPQALASLTTATYDSGACAKALQPLLDSATGLVLGGFTGSGALAHEIVLQLSSRGATPPLVVLGSVPAEEWDAGATALARALAAAAGR